MATKVGKIVNPAVLHMQDTRVIFNEIHSVLFSAVFSCESASHHFALFFFETGSLVGFVILELPWYFFQRARKLAQNLLEPKKVALAKKVALVFDLLHVI